MHVSNEKLETGILLSMIHEHACPIQTDHNSLTKPGENGQMML